jgi:hypothetical protein
MKKKQQRPLDSGVLFLPFGLLFVITSEQEISLLSADMHLFST